MCKNIGPSFWYTTPLDIRGSFWNNPFHLKNQMFWKQVEEGFLMNLNCPICRWISMYRVNLLRFTFDYDEDFLFFKSVIEKLGDRMYDISDNNLVVLLS